MTAAEFAEGVLNIELLPYQKEFINKAYEAAQKHQILVCHPPRCRTNYYLRYLQALTFNMAGQDESVVEKEKVND